MRVILDTHLLLWALSSPDRLPKQARQRIASSEVYVSAASIWEISIKNALGKIDADPTLVLSGVEPAGFRHLPISSDHAVAVSILPSVHKDPFDRMLVAQAKVEPMILLTNDAVLRDYGDLIEVV